MITARTRDELAPVTDLSLYDLTTEDETPDEDSDQHILDMLRAEGF